MLWSFAVVSRVTPVRSAERQDVRQLSSRAALLAPVVVQRNLGDIENAVFRVDQLRTVKETDGKQPAPNCAACLCSRCVWMKQRHVCGFVDGCVASVRVEQCIQLDGLPLEGAYGIQTVTTATPAAHDNASAVDGPTARALIITVEGAVECNPGASIPGLKGVIEGILYSQVRFARSKALLSVCSSCDSRVRAVALRRPSADLRTPCFISRVRHQSCFSTC
jgi:hypothetical protein